MSEISQAASAETPFTESKSYERLPAYARSLLRIRLPLAVNLARKKETISEILQLGPGTVISFDKACDEPLQLSVANVPLAEGDAVKVGDRFGLRISRILLPHERFHSVVAAGEAQRQEE